MHRSDNNLGLPRRLLAHIRQGLRERSRLSNDALLSSGLSTFLLLAYVLVCYSAVLAIGNMTNPTVTDPAAPVPWWLNSIALLVIGLGLVPVNRWIRRGIDQLIYGWPDDPYRALSLVQSELLADPSPQAIVPAVIASVAAALKLPYAAITTLPDGETITVGIPPIAAERVSIPLAYAEIAVGTLEVAARRPHVPLSPGELQLLDNLARQIGITLHAAQLSEALQVSRAQLVTAREEERRRIRRDLHDGLGPTLAALRLQLGIARRTLRNEPEAAEALLDELRADVVEATAAIRRLVYDLRPPLLDEHGLTGALRSLARLIDPQPLQIELPETVPVLPAAVEVALYRIAAEALLNVARHARSSRCTLALTVTATGVELRMSDTGTGLPAEHRDGVGLTTMRERAEELGGNLSLERRPGAGVTVVARIPGRF